MKVNELDLELVDFDGGGMGIYHYQGKPFTGLMLILDQDEDVVGEREYVDGYEEGWTRYFYKNGKLKEEHKSSKNLLIEGTFKEFDEDGNLISE